MSYLSHADLGGRPNAERVSPKPKATSSMPAGNLARWR